MDIDGLLKVAQVGGMGVMLFLLANLWSEFKEQNKFIREMLLKLQENDEKAAKERKKLARAMDTDLESRTDIPVQTK